MADMEMLVGPQQNAIGAKRTARGLKNGGIGTGAVRSPYEEMVLEGNVFSVADQSAKTIPAGLSASPTTVVLYNPAGSGKNLVVVKVTLLNLVIWGAVSAVGIGISRNVVAAAITGTAAPAFNCLQGSGTASVAKPLTTATLPAAPIYDYLIGAGGTGAVNLSAVIPVMERWFDGSLILKPGTAASIQASTASGAGAWCEWTWKEIDELVG